MTDEVFAYAIENIKNSKGISYIDAVLLWCEDNDYEVETAANLVKSDPVLKLKIAYEAESAHLLKSQANTGNTLPL